MFTHLNALSEFERMHREMNSVFHRSPFFAQTSLTPFPAPWEDTFALLDARWPFNQVNTQPALTQAKQNEQQVATTNTNTALDNAAAAAAKGTQVATTGAKDNWLASPFPAFDQLTSVNVGLTETDKEYLVQADVPNGLNKQDVHVNVDIQHRLLTISAEKKQENEEKDENQVVKKSSSYTSFSRTVHLPRNSDLHDVKAKFDEANKLQIIIPKVEAKKTERVKKINIE